MNTRWKLILCVALPLLVTGSVLLSACAILGGGSTAELDNRITKLESDVQASGKAVTALQQQVQTVQQKVNALTPTPAAPVTPPASTPTETPPVSPPPAAPSKPTGLLASANVVLDKLTITPVQANLGQTVTITIDVTNKGNTDGKYNVVFFEKPVPQFTSVITEYAIPITLKAGETQTLSFTTSKSAVGTYSIEVGSKSDRYSVIDPNAPPSS